MLRATSALCPTTQTGTTSPQRATATPIQVQLGIVQGTIQEMHTIMEPDTRSILVHEEDSITTTVTDIKPTFQNGICGKGRNETRIGASEMMPLILIYSIQQNKRGPILWFVILASIIFP